MYLFVCFILLVSLEGLKANTGSIGTTPFKTGATPSKPGSTPSTQLIQTSSSAPTTKHMITLTPLTVPKTTSSIKQGQDQSMEAGLAGCLINLNDKKEMALWLMIAILLLICVLLLVIIMCLVCKRCRGTRNGEVVVLKSSEATRRNSVNGGPSETDIMLKDCSSVKVEIETTPDESQEPEQVGGNQVPTEENKNSANDPSKTALTQEGDQSDNTALKMEDLQKAE